MLEIEMVANNPFSIAWLDTDNNAGTCFDNSGASSTSCDYNGLTYTAQELLVCVQPENPSYCASVSV